jgi:hypothetical protein
MIIRVALAVLVGLAAGWITALLDGSPGCEKRPRSDGSIVHPICVSAGVRVWLVALAAVAAASVTWVVLGSLRKGNRAAHRNRVTESALSSMT